MIPRRVAYRGFAGNAPLSTMYTLTLVPSKTVKGSALRCNTAPVKRMFGPTVVPRRQDDSMECGTCKAQFKNLRQFNGHLRQVAECAAAHPSTKLMLKDAIQYPRVDGVNEVEIRRIPSTGAEETLDHILCHFKESDRMFGKSKSFREHVVKLDKIKTFFETEKRNEENRKRDIKLKEESFQKAKGHVITESQTVALATTRPFEDPPHREPGPPD